MESSSSVIELYSESEEDMSYQEASDENESNEDYKHLPLFF